IPLFYKRFFDVITGSVSSPDIVSELIGIIIWVFAINIVVMVIMRVGFISLNSLESATMSRLRRMAFDYMINHSHSFFANNFTGSLVQRINRFSRSFERLYDTLAFQVIPLTVS